MIKIIFKTPDGNKIELDVTPDSSIMAAARANNIPGIDADCGGCMSCGTCHVIIDPIWHDKLPEQSEIEREMLEYVPEPQNNTRLTCQIPITEALDGIVLHLPKRQR